MRIKISKLARSRKTRYVYSKAIIRRVKEIVLRDQDKEPSYPKKIKVSATVFPEPSTMYDPHSMTSYNNWTEEYRVSSRIPK